MRLLQPYVIGLDAVARHAGLQRYVKQSFQHTLVGTQVTEGWLNNRVNTALSCHVFTQLAPQRRR